MQNRRGGREGVSFALSLSFSLFFFFAPRIPLSAPLFILEALILQRGEERGGEGWREQRKRR